MIKIGMGLESNSPKVLAWLEKGNTPEINQKAVDLLRKHSLPFHASFIRDVPMESKADLKLTYDFIKLNKISFDMYRLMLFPNTPIYQGSLDWDSCKIHLYRQGLLKSWVKRVYRKVSFAAKQMQGAK